MLILGAGWTSSFLIPLLEEEKISYAATSTTGRAGTMEFVFDPSSDDLSRYKKLPSAETVLITFPLKGKDQSKHLHDLYGKTHPHASARFIQLGSTGIFQIPNQSLWVSRHSPYDKTDPRAIAEDELLELGGCVLNLAGLWGGARMPRTFIKRVATTKEQLRTKTSLHLVHGKDVARSILALHHSFTPGQRWMLTDLFVYDWFALIMGWGDGSSSEGDASGPHLDWVREVMEEEGIKALPRCMEALGRCYDSREFYSTFGFSPVRARV